LCRGRCRSTCTVGGYRRHQNETQQTQLFSLIKVIRHFPNGADYRSIVTPIGNIKHRELFRFECVRCFECVGLRRTIKGLVPRTKTAKGIWG
jgi:hypothetical protein